MTLDDETEDVPADVNASVHRLRHRETGAVVWGVAVTYYEVNTTNVITVDRFTFETEKEAMDFYRSLDERFGTPTGLH